MSPATLAGAGDHARRNSNRVERIEGAIRALDQRLQRVERFMWLATGIMTATGGIAVTNLIRGLGGP